MPSRACSAARAVAPHMRFIDDMTCHVQTNASSFCKEKCPGKSKYRMQSDDMQGIAGHAAF